MFQLVLALLLLASPAVALGLRWLSWGRQGRIAYGATALLSFLWVRTIALDLFATFIQGHERLSAADVWTHIAVLAGTFGVLVWLASLIVWKGRNWFILAAPVLFIVVVSGTLTHGTDWRDSALALAALFGAAMLPFAARATLEEEGKTRLGARIAIGIILAPALLSFVMHPHLVANEPQFAEHEWHATITPEEPVAFTAYIPFLWHEDYDAMHPLWRELEGAERHNHTHIVVHGFGETTVTAREAFYGSTAARETFARVPDDLTLRSSIPVTIDVTYDFSGGNGHTCWWQGSVHADFGAKALPAPAFGGLCA